GIGDDMIAKFEKRLGYAQADAAGRASDDGYLPAVRVPNSSWSLFCHGAPRTAPGCFWRFWLQEVVFGVDIPMDGFGIGASLFRAIADLARNFTIQARQADVEARLERVTVAAGAKVHFGIDCGIGGEPHFHLSCHNLDGAEETTRPT